MNIAVWIIQGLLAIMFAMAGIMKSTQPKEKLLKTLPWVADCSLTTVRFIGISELLGAIGIIIPQLVNILPRTTVIAAFGLAAIMVLASSYHIRKKEYKNLGFTVILFILTAIVANYRM
jgi:uncharacterized membrane protein